MSDDLLAWADELYGLPLGDFTARRDALVREHRGQDVAAALKALRKPSLAAWVVNLLVRRDPDQVAQVLAVGEALREAQAGLDADELRALTRQRRQLTAAVTTQARRLSREAGTRVTEAVAGQVEATLTAAMLDAGAAQAVRSGLLVAALSSTGVDAVDAGAAVALPEALGFTATAVSATPPADEAPTLHVVPDPEAHAKARATAEEALAQAQREKDAAVEAVTAASSDVERLEARGLQLQAELAELRGRIAELESQQEDADDELADAEDVRAEASETLATIERDVAEARAALDRLS